MAELRKYRTEQELARLLKVITKPRDRAMFLVCYWRGLRVSEIGLLKLADWDRAGHRLYVFRLKGSLAGEYLLYPQEHRALVKWVAARGEAPGPLFPSRESDGTSGIGRQMLHVLMRHSRISFDYKKRPSTRINSLETKPWTPSARSPPRAETALEPLHRLGLRD